MRPTSYDIIPRNPADDLVHIIRSYLSVAVEHLAQWCNDLALK